MLSVICTIEHEILPHQRAIRWISTNRCTLFKFFCIRILVSRCTFRFTIKYANKLYHITVCTQFFFLLILLKYSNFDRKWSLPMNRLKHSNKNTIANKIRRVKRMFVDLSIKFTMIFWAIFIIKVFRFFYCCFLFIASIWTDLWPEKSVLIKLYCKLVLRIHNIFSDQKKSTIW